MADEQTCYFPSGSISTLDTPCHSPSIGGGASACCASSDICLNNTLCLGQTGSALISRGTCTDRTWQNPECPQYCADGKKPPFTKYLRPDSGIAVSPNGGVNLHLLDVDNDPERPIFCCSNVEPSNNTCMFAAGESTSPFGVPAGLVIFNRSSGSTLPNHTNDATVTITATATLTTTITTLVSSPDPVKNTSSPLSVSPSSSQSSSTKKIAISAGVGGALAFALLTTLILLWRQRKQKQSLIKGLSAWEARYRHARATQASDLGAINHQLPLAELHGQQHLVSQLEGWKPDEIDGVEIQEMANTTRRL